MRLVGYCTPCKLKLTHGDNINTTPHDDLTDNPYDLNLILSFDALITVFTLNIKSNIIKRSFEKRKDYKFGGQ